MFTLLGHEAPYRGRQYLYTRDLEYFKVTKTLRTSKLIFLIYYFNYLPLSNPFRDYVKVNH